MTDLLLPPLEAAPIDRPVMTQFWADVTFLHWRYDPTMVQSLLPPGVEVDVFDGAAWVGLVPFRMERLGFGTLPPVPRLGTFPEVNVRTYVRAGDHRGVWFFSLDIDLLLPMLVARGWYHLPYCVGDVRHERAGDRITTHVSRRRPRTATGATTDLEVVVGSASATGPLTDFLTSRWGLVAPGRGGRLRWAAVDHPEWQLYRARVDRIADSLVEAAGLPAPDGPAHAMYSPGVPVRVGLPRRIAAS
ncbi:MAG: DUF2071 domain-containing protein [Acidimicrobiales bacterium]